MKIPTPKFKIGDVVIIEKNGNQYQSVVSDAEFKNQKWHYDVGTREYAGEKDYSIPEDKLIRF